MSFAFLPLYTGDYLRDTRHLSPLKHGIYLLLLMHSWDQRGPLPLDEQECAGIANCRSADEIEALRYILGKFFIEMDDGYYNKRMQKEIEKAGSISAARSEAGKKGYEAKAKQLLSKSRARAKQVPLPPPPPPQLQPPPHLPPKDQKPFASRDESRSAVRAGETPVIQIPCVGGEVPIYADLVAELQTLYPAVDIEQTLREIRGWNLTNPKKRKTAGGVLKHVNAWMMREQNRG